MKLEANVVIKAPADKVFDFIANFENNPRWQSGMQEAYFTSEGPLRVGSTYAQVARFLGRRVESTFEVLAYEPGRMVKATSTSGSFPITFTRQVEPLAEGTRVTAVITGEAQGFFKIAGPLLRWMAQKSVTADYQNLKKILEAEETGSH